MIRVVKKSYAVAFQPLDFIEQKESEATYAKKIEKTESKIDWNDNAKNIIAKINALNPNPGSWFDLFGSRIKIIKAKEVNTVGQPGVILNENFTIACSKNAIQVLELQKEGKKRDNLRFVPKSCFLLLIAITIIII